MTIRTLTTTLLIMGLFSFLGCSKPIGTPEATAAQQKISLPSPADLDRLAKQRAVIEHYLGDDDSRTKYQTPAGKLGLLRALLAQQVFKPTQTYELQCMGIVLGDTFVQEMGMEWITVEDEHGSDPAVRLPGTSVIIYPLTMISKRVERGESVDVFDLFNGIADQIDQVKHKAK
jgi:hypothetical protein